MRTKTASSLSLALPATTADPPTTTCSSSWPLSSSGSAQDNLLRRRVTGQPPASSRTFPSPCSAFKLISGILPNFVIDARGARFSELMQLMDSSSLGDIETPVDIKGWISVNHQTMLPSAPNKDSSSLSTAGRIRCTQGTTRPPRTSTASITILRMAR